jgi:hypothetical protein
MMEWQTYGSVSVAKGEMKFNESLEFKSSHIGLDSFLSELYEELHPSYPKFFKMDNLGKLAFLLSEMLISKLPWIKIIPKEKISICLQTAHGSLDTDLRYNQTITNQEEYFPSPSLFVYTLPNIAIGEICIRNGFMGENVCLVNEQFDPEIVSPQLHDWFSTGESELCLLGWIDVWNDHYEALLMAIGPKSQKKDHSFPQKNSNS